MVCATNKEPYPKVYILSISLPYHYYKINMLQKKKIKIKI